jgi:hypothetical protein
MILFLLVVDVGTRFLKLEEIGGAAVKWVSG